MNYKLSYAYLVLITRVANELYIVCVILVLMAFIGHEPWIFVLIAFVAHRLCTSYEDLVLLACVAHELWTFCVILVLITSV